MFHPSELELGETTKLVLDEVERTNPTLVVFDSSEMGFRSESSVK